LLVERAFSPGALSADLAAHGGEILETREGAHAFRYDPVFCYPPFGRSFGDVSAARKLSVCRSGQVVLRDAGRVRGTCSISELKGLTSSGSIQ
jgi:hypothetical protein